MILKPSVLAGWILLFVSGPRFTRAQNTDENLRVNFLEFTLGLTPANAVQCSATEAETVRNIAEDCLQTLSATECADIFADSPPEQILLGGAECRGNDDVILVFGGAMDFPVEGATPGDVNQCVQRVIQGDSCIQAYQSVYPSVTGISYSLDTPQPTGAPSSTPTAAPSIAPTAAPTTNAPTSAPSAAPSSRPSLRQTASPTSGPTESPSTSPSGSGGKDAPIREDDVAPRGGGSSDRRDDLGLYIGAVGGALCLLLLLFLLIAKRRRKEEEVEVEVKDLNLVEQPKGGLHTLDSLHPQAVPPPPGILHNSSPRTSPRAQSQLFHSLPDDDYSAPGTSIGDPDLTLISSVDMGSTDGSESFVDQSRNVSFTISKDMLGGSSEVPKNRNAVLSRLGASLTPDPIRGSSGDGGDAPPSPSSRGKDGFYQLQDDDDDGTDEELMLEIPADPEPFRHEDFAPDTDWDPDDTDEGEGLDTRNMFRDRKSPVNVDHPEGGLQLPIPPELKDSTRRKPKSSTPRSVLGGSGTAPSVVSSSSGTSLGS